MTEDFKTIFNSRYKEVWADKKQDKDGNSKNLSNDDIINSSLTSEKTKYGFYYDTELEDPFMSITLHPNTYLDVDSDGKKEWKAFPESECLPPIRENIAGLDGKSEPWHLYSKQPIVRCIMGEDFSITMTNNFNDSDLGNEIEGLFNRAKPYAPVAKAWAKALEKGSKGVHDNNSFGSSIVDTIQGWVDKGTSWLEKGSEYLNKSLFVQGTRMVSYGGSSVGLGMLDLKFIAFSDWVRSEISGSTKKYTFQNVEDYVKELRKYCIGIYEPLSEEALSKFGVEDQDVKTMISKYIGFQSPPAGFTMDTVNLNNRLKGTMRLNIGGVYAVDNLVMKNVNVVFSKVQAKDPTCSGRTCPLYAEISITLSPAGAIIDTNLDDILSHKGVDTLMVRNQYTYQTSLKTRAEELKKQYKGAIDQIETDLKSRYEKPSTENKEE